jgi:hypothetical protein
MIKGVRGCGSAAYGTVRQKSLVCRDPQPYEYLRAAEGSFSPIYLFKIDSLQVRLRGVKARADQEFYASASGNSYL